MLVAGACHRGYTKLRHFRTEAHAPSHDCAGEKRARHEFQEDLAILFILYGKKEAKEDLQSEARVAMNDLIWDSFSVGGATESGRNQ